MSLCHTGTVPPPDPPPDCYRLVTVYAHAADGTCACAAAVRGPRRAADELTRLGQVWDLPEQY